MISSPFSACFSSVTISRGLDVDVKDDNGDDDALASFSSTEAIVVVKSGELVLLLLMLLAIVLVTIGTSSDLVAVTYSIAFDSCCS